MNRISKISIAVLILIMTGCSTSNIKNISELNNEVSKIRFDYIDNNQNSKISEQEFISYEKEKGQLQKKEHANIVIASCDENGDKQISLDELREENLAVPVVYEINDIGNQRCMMNRHYFGVKDTNKDNVLTFNELIVENPMPMPMPVQPSKDRDTAMKNYLTQKYKKCDKNNDDKLNMLEATSSRCRMPSDDFTKADKDNDKFLTLQEMLSAAKNYVQVPRVNNHTRPSPIKIPPSAPKEVRLMMSMHRCDTNKDRKLSEVELTSKVCGFTKEDFMDADHNKDGYFSQEDMAVLNLLRNFRRLDTNQDGFLSFEEFKKNARVYY